MQKLTQVIVLSSSLLFLVGTAGPAWAQAEPTAAPVGTSKPGDDLSKQDDPIRGWIFFKDPTKEKKPEMLEPAPPKPEEKPDKAKRCKDVKKWSSDCGFIDPGMDFDWQAKQRDALLNSSVMSKNDSKAVEEFQKYNKWVLDKAIQFANLWQFNLAQNPELSASYTAPISQFGLALVSKLESAESKNIFDLIKKEGGLLAYFTRDSCSWCHEMLPTALSLGRESGIPVYNASLEGACLSGVDKDKCMLGNEVLEPASRLQITKVPTLVLYLPPNTWIRIANGVEDLATIKANIVNFSAAYRAALLAGIPAQDGRIPVDFNVREKNKANGLGEGLKLPIESDVKTVLTTSSVQ